MGLGMSLQLSRIGIKTMNNGFNLYAQCTYTAEIEFPCEGKEELLIAELMLLRAAWPSIKWEIGVDVLWIFSYNQNLTEDATNMFLSTVDRHEWWIKR